MLAPPLERPIFPRNLIEIKLRGAGLRGLADQNCVNRKVSYQPSLASRSRFPWPSDIAF